MQNFNGGIDLKFTIVSLFVDLSSQIVKGGKIRILVYQISPLTFKVLFFYTSIIAPANALLQIIEPFASPPLCYNHEQLSIVASVCL